MTDTTGANGDALHPTARVEESPPDMARAVTEADAAVEHTADALASADRGRDAAQRKVGRANEDLAAAHLAVEHAQADFEAAQADHDSAVQRREALGGGQ